MMKLQFAALLTTGLASALLLVVVAILAHFTVGRHSSTLTKRKRGVQSREYLEINNAVGGAWTREIAEENIRKLEITALLYDCFQVVFFCLSIPAPLWSYFRDGYLEFMVYFTRLLFLDLPSSTTTSFLVLLLVCFAIYITFSILHHLTQSFDNGVWRSYHQMTYNISRFEAYAPDMLNFFLWSMFWPFIRFCFRIISCADKSSVHSGYWLFDTYYGDFGCWEDKPSIFMLFCACFVGVYFMAAVFWNAEKVKRCPYYYVAPRYSVLSLLIKFFLTFTYFVCYQVPIVTAVFSMICFSILLAYTYYTLPYLSGRGDPIALNTTLLGSYTTAIYLSIISLFIMIFRPSHSAWGSLLAGVIPVYVCSTCVFRRLLKRNKSHVFENRGKRMVRELLTCVVTDDMTVECCSQLTRISSDSMSENVLVREISFMSREDRSTFFTPQEPKLPVLRWWNKWQVMHPSNNTKLRMVYKKITRDSLVPRLTDLAVYTVLRNYDNWSEDQRISDDMKDYIAELLIPDPTLFEDEEALIE